MQVFLGTIMAVGFNYAPRGWAFCNGQLLSIAQNSALFALLGTMYGGDGQQTFGLPDLRGRTIVGSQGNGPGIAPVQQGEMAGTNQVTVIGSGAVSISLTSANLPAHTHPASMSPTGLTATTTLAASTGTSGGLVPAAGTLLSGTAGGPSGAAIYVPPAQAGTTVDLGGINTTLGGNGSVTVGANTGGGQPLAAPVQTQALTSIMQPYTGLNYIIALEGIFPSRN
ncbi:MAG: tail fiber protein [Ramlibacter sp.]|nr:tail fiber protein [Ramlibacter sp.]MBX3656908.1 tail fiber protein [Ramlibacter sp.]MCW5651589.1 tail fiber protein [Ramlibacter sp.]